MQTSSTERSCYGIFYLGLLDLATAYCETGLKFKCQKLIREGINEDNAALLYAAAIKYQADVRISSVFSFLLGENVRRGNYFAAVHRLLLNGRRIPLSVCSFGGWAKS